MSCTLTIILIFWQYHHLKEHQSFVIKGQSRFYQRTWPLIVVKIGDMR